MPGMLLRCVLFMPVSLVVNRRTFRASVDGLPLATGVLSRPLHPPLADALRIAWLAWTQRGCRSGRRDHQRHWQSTADVALLWAPRAQQIASCESVLYGSERWIAGKKVLREADRAQRKAHRFRDAFVFGQRDLAATAAQSISRPPSVPGSPITPRWIRRASSRPEMISTFRPGLGLYPREKSQRIAGVAQGRGGNRSHVVAAVQFDRAIETFECHQGCSPSLGQYTTGFEHTVAQSRDFAILMEHFELMLLDSRDFQSAGVGTNVNAAYVCMCGEFHRKLIHLQCKIHHFSYIISAGTLARGSVPKPTNVLPVGQALPNSLWGLET